MHPTVSQYAEALEELGRNVSREESVRIADNLSGLLKRRGEERKLEEIVAYLEKSESEREGRIVVTAVTAYEARPENRVALARQAQKIFPGKKIDLRYEVDRDLIGGVRLQTDEILYDASLSRAVRDLKHSLLKA